MEPRSGKKMLEFHKTERDLAMDVLATFLAANLMPVNYNLTDVI